MMRPTVPLILASAAAGVLLGLSGCASILPFSAEDPDSEEPVTVGMLEEYPGETPGESSEDPREDPRGPDQEPRNTEVLPDLAFRLDTTRRQLEERMGKPGEVETEEVQNEHHPDITDTIYTYRYEDIAFTVYRAGFDGREFLVMTTITGPSYAVPQGVTVGASEEDLIRAFGGPGKKDGRKIIYSLSSGRGAMVQIVYVFTFATSRLERAEKIEMALEIF